MEYIIERNDELCHFGIKGMKLGVRRYQNADGSLTDVGRKRQQKLTGSNKEVTLVKGTKLYRISDSDKSDTSKDKIYVSATEESGDYYLQALGSSKIYNKGKAYVHEYIAKNDLKMPSKKVMEKIELGLLKDKNVQKELIDSLMKKGYSREEATKQTRAYSAGKAFMEKAKDVSLGALAGAWYGAAGGSMTRTVPGLVTGAGIGAVAGAGVGLAVPTNERTRALTTTRISYGDKNNKVINKTLRDELTKKGYNAMKDYNDRRAYGEKGKQAVIVFDSDDNIKSTKISEVTAKDFGKSYARNYLKEHPESKLDFNDLVKDGENKYKRLYNEGVIMRARAKENKQILEEDKNKYKSKKETSDGYSRNLSSKNQYSIKRKS